MFKNNSLKVEAKLEILKFHIDNDIFFHSENKTYKENDMVLTFKEVSAKVSSFEMIR